MGQLVKLVPVICAGAIVAGCGLNALRTEYAGNVGSEGTAVAAASTQFLRDVEASRRLANIEMIVADPACGSSPAMIRRAIVMNKAGPGWLCLMPNEPRQYGVGRLSLAPISSQIQPTILLVSSLSAYTKAVAAAVDSKPSDPMKPLLDALETARSAQGLILSTTGGQGGPVPPAEDKGIKAIGDFVSFLSQLSNEPDQVRRLRQLIAKNPDGALPLVDALQGHLATWENSRKADDGLRLAVNGAMLRRAIDATPPLPPEERRKALTDFYQIDDAVTATADIYPALSKSLGTLADADNDLRRVLVEHPNLTKAERAKVAELNRWRAINAIDIVTALITSFKGA